jgi:hypothetical protein
VAERGARGRDRQYRLGPNCDTETGKIKLLSVYAPPCVEPFEGDNGGATAPGVTADTIKVVQYIADPALDPLTAATISGAGADVSPETAAETVQGFADLYNKLFETYGRTVEVETYVGTGAGDDREAAKADAIAIAEMDPFMVVGGPNQASAVFVPGLASRGIICGPLCTIALPEVLVEEYAPYTVLGGATPEQAVALAAEMIGKLAGPGKAELAGDDATRAKDGVYGLLHYDTPVGDYKPVFEAFVEQLRDNGIELTTDVEFTLDLARAQENARTNISRLKEAGVTTISYTGDPLTPASLTQEATAQNHHPEWILGPSVFLDRRSRARVRAHTRCPTYTGFRRMPCTVECAHWPATGRAPAIARACSGVGTPSASSHPQILRTPWPAAYRSKISVTIAASAGSTSGRRSRAPSRALAGLRCGSSVSTSR